MAARLVTDMGSTPYIHAGVMAMFHLSFHLITLGDYLILLTYIMIYTKVAIKE